MKSAFRPLFFTGGTAMRELAQNLAERRISSVHIVTTFDSGGSTAQLRKSFAMPAVGDLRNRLLALADKKRLSPQVPQFVNLRLPLNISGIEAQERLAALLTSSSSWKGIPAEVAELFRHSLYFFRERMPGAFDARGANIGNLMLAGSYLENGRDLGAAISLFSAILHICGVVLPISAANLHLGARLRSGRLITGQDKFHNPPDIIEDIFLSVCVSSEDGRPIVCIPPPFPGVLEEIGRASLICLPMGSFFSSVLPHLLPAGVVRAILKSHAHKIFIPNSGEDRELRGVPLQAQLEHILRLLERDAPERSNGRLLDYILVDRQHGAYQVEDWTALKKFLDKKGIELRDRAVVDPENPQRHLPGPLLDALLEIGESANRPWPSSL